MAQFQTIEASPDIIGTFMGDLNSVSCSRCGGLFIRESLFDLLDDAGQMRCWALRCIQCGDVVDSLILKHRHVEELPSPKKVHRRRWSKIQSVSS